MSSATCFNVDQSKILSSGNGLRAFFTEHFSFLFLTDAKTNCQDKSTCSIMMATGYDVCKDPKMSVDLCRKSCNIC